MLLEIELDKMIEAQLSSGAKRESVVLHVSKQIYAKGVLEGLFINKKSKKKKLRHCDSTYKGVRVYVR